MIGDPPVVRSHSGNLKQAKASLRRSTPQRSNIQDDHFLAAVPQGDQEAPAAVAAGFCTNPLQ